MMIEKKLLVFFFLVFIILLHNCDFQLNIEQLLKVGLIATISPNRAQMIRFSTISNIANFELQSAHMFEFGAYRLTNR
jgi:hypothetical protein